MRLALFMVLCALAGPAAAAPLVPAVCGVRHTLWIEHYAAQLYVPAGQTAAALGDAAQPKMLRMRILNSMLMPPEIPRKWQDALRPVLDDAALARLHAGYRSLEGGDTVVVSYAPGAGVELRVNDRVIASVAGHQAIDALLQAWADDQPLERKLAGTVSRNPCA
jgi:hypothetical protein